MKRRIVTAIVVVIALLVVAVLVKFRPNRASGPMPTYQGRTAQYWLAQVFTSNQTQALQAFRDMGTNALPVLINAFEQKDSAWSRFYQKLYSRMPRWIQNHLSKPTVAKEDWSAAELVILNMGGSIGPTPQFLRLMSYPNNPARPFIMESVHIRLTPQNTDWVPVLMNCLADTNAYMRFQAARGLEQLGPAAKAAIPALTALMNDKTRPSGGPSGWDWALEARVAAATAVWRIDYQINGPAQVLREGMNAKNAHVRGWACIHLHQMIPSDASLIPPITSMLQGADHGLQLSAAYVIGTYGPAAKEAVPALRNIVSTANDADLRNRAMNSLKKIDPEAAAELEKK